jgi:hypothetical protein
MFLFSLPSALDLPGVIKTTIFIHVFLPTKTQNETQQQGNDDEPKA